MPSRNIVCALAVSAGAALTVSCSTSDFPTSVAGEDVATVTPGAPTGAKVRKGFIWSKEEGFQVIALPPGATSMTVNALNNAGDVVGYVTRGEGSENYRAFLWSAAGGYNALGSLAGPDGISLAFRVSDAGEVTGLSEGPSAIFNGPMGIALNDYFSWTASSGMRAISGPGFSPDLRPVSAGGKLILPSGMDCSSVSGANDNGQAIGYAGGMTVDGCRFTVALRWNADGRPLEIAQCGSLPWCGTTLTDINNAGEVVGYRETSGFRWTASGGMAWMPLANTMLQSINDSGDSAGAVGSGAVLTPLVWMASGEIRTITLPAGAKYGGAVGINQKGQVAGNFQ